MTTYFVTRHTNAKEWATEEGIAIDRVIEHLDLEQIKAGDKVLGSLPVNLVAELTAKKVRYFHLSLNVPIELRGQEISAQLMREFGAKLEEFQVFKSTHLNN
ncbi:MAG: CRISPR-associated protein Csx16 [Methylococcales bacterium]|nr:CRISPR-associated protein Csx16 [Methylococcales bacterium]